VSHGQRCDGHSSSDLSPAYQPAQRQQSTYLLPALLLLVVVLVQHPDLTTLPSSHIVVKVKEADLYSAFIEVPYTQGTQVWITQCYLQTTPYLPLPRKHSPDGASQTEVADI